MRINLCEIIEMPGKSLPFECELETERLMCPAIKTFVSAPRGAGEIVNTAGTLNLRGTIAADLIFICDRCGGEYERHLEIPVEAKLAADVSDEDDPETYPLDGDWLDVSDVLETSFILATDQKSLCSEDCAGLCSGCGKNLNCGPCDCKKEIDPRLAVLAQLLDKED